MSSTTAPLRVVSSDCRHDDYYFRRNLTGVKYCTLCDPQYRDPRPGTDDDAMFDQMVHGLAHELWDRVTTAACELRSDRVERAKLIEGCRLCLTLMDYFARHRRTTA